MTGMGTHANKQLVGLGIAVAVLLRGCFSGQAAAKYQAQDESAPRRSLRWGLSCCPRWVSPR